MAIVAFALGTWLCQRLPELSSLTTLLLGTLGVAIAAGALFVLDRCSALPDNAFRVGVLLLALLVGLGWAVLRAQWRIGDELPSEWEGRDVVVTGVVEDLPDLIRNGVRFMFAVEHADGPVPSHILLSSSSFERKGSARGEVLAVRPGERWRFTVRLKKPHGFANPGGFDYEASLLERGVRATGHVRQGGEAVRLDANVFAPMAYVHRLRDSIRTRFAAALPNAEFAGVLIALAVGDQRAIPDEQWTVFRKTGVAHLISISGLHVSMVGLLVGWLVGWRWRRSTRRVLRLPAMKAAAAAGFCAAAAYAVLAGLGIPTQRSLIMLAVVALALLFGREAHGSRVLALALFCVLVVDPWAVVAAGFWLSFFAAGVIMYMLGGRLETAKGWRAAVGMQLGITFASLPATLALFNAFSIVSPIANALAIPAVSFLITPLVLVAIVVPFAPLLHLAHWLMGLLMVFLDGVANLPFAMWQQAAAPGALVAAAVAGVAWIFLPRGTPARYMGMLAVLPMLGWSPPRPEHGAFRLVVLDIGNGTAVHVQTARHDLVYDTGPAYGAESDAGERVILPYLQAEGVPRLDRVVISHDDLDHTGGAKSLVEGISVGDLFTNLPRDRLPAKAAGTPVRECVAGDRWQWDGVEFEVLHPAAAEPSLHGDNDHSCVVRVASPSGSALLLGDVELPAERRMLERGTQTLSSDVIVVAHHGSKTSSGADFIAASGGREAIFSVGYLNNYHHPHPSVVDRWTQAGARGWRTDRQGAVRVEFGSSRMTVEALRSAEARYWYGH